MSHERAERFWAKVDKTDGCWNWTAAKAHGYGRFNIALRTTIAAHRFSYELENGPIAQGLVLDHTCHNKACVNPSHLRVATNKQNIENRVGADSNSSSGVRGVYWNRRARKYQTTIGHNGKTHYAGMYDNLADAEAAAIAKRNELFTHNDIDRTAA